MATATKVEWHDPSPGALRRATQRTCAGLWIAGSMLLAMCGCGSKTGTNERSAVPRKQAQTKQAQTKQVQTKRQQPARRTKKLTREILLKSKKLGRKFLIFNQRIEGNFTYNSHFLTAQQSTDDGPVRQAGAFWGLVLLHQDDPQPESKAAILRAVKFFRRHSRQRLQRRWIVYPGQRIGQTGLVALVTLALIDYLRVEEDKSLQDLLKLHLNFLVTMRRPDGHFWPNYDLLSEKPTGQPSPYFDGECLLALTKAARYRNRSDLQRLVVESAKVMNDAYFGKKLKDGSDRDDTKGFYQWGSMAYFELSETKWAGTQWCSTAVVDAADWMIDTHKTLQRKKNTGYAYEGIALAHELARRQQRFDKVSRFAEVIDAGMSKLVSWQVGGPTPNEFLQKHATEDAQWVGGIMNAADDPWLRIDVTQHQMHATILLLRWVYQAKQPNKSK